MERPSNIVLEPQRLELHANGSLAVSTVSSLDATTTPIEHQIPNQITNSPPSVTNEVTLGEPSVILDKGKSKCIEVNEELAKEDIWDLDDDNSTMEVVDDMNDIGNAAGLQDNGSKDESENSGGEESERNSLFDCKCDVKEFINFVTRAPNCIFS